MINKYNIRQRYTCLNQRWNRSLRIKLGAAAAILPFPDVMWLLFHWIKLILNVFFLFMIISSPYMVITAEVVSSWKFTMVIYQSLYRNNKHIVHNQSYNVNTVLTVLSTVFNIFLLLNNVFSMPSPLKNNGNDI